MGRHGNQWTLEGIESLHWLWDGFRGLGWKLRLQRGFCLGRALTSVLGHFSFYPFDED